MEDKTIPLTMLFCCMFGALISFNQLMHTQEKKELPKPSAAMIGYTAGSLAYAAIGSRLPINSPAATHLMRKYFLAGMTGQTVAGTAASLSETLKKEKPSFAKIAADLGYGAYSMAFVEIARRLPYNTPARALLLKRYTMLCILSQPLGIIGKDYAAPAFCSLKRKLEDYTQSLDQEQFEESTMRYNWSE